MYPLLLKIPVKDYLWGGTIIHFEDGFISLVVLDGEITITYDNGTLKAIKGNSIFIPATLSVNMNGKAEILYSTI